MDAQPKPTWGDRWKDLGLLSLLLLFIVLLRGWMLTHTVVAARDSIGYIRYALEFEKYASDDLSLWETWQKVLDKNHQHPGYPLAVWAMSAPVRYFRGCLDPEGMQLSAQLASNLAAILLIVPTFFIGKILFDRQVGFWGALLFQCLPVTNHLLSDGISEPVFLLFSTSALLFAMCGVLSKSPGQLALCGLFCGLSYLTRPEGALVLTAAGFTLAGMQITRSWRRSWGKLTTAGVALILPAVALGSLYFLATGKFTNKPSIERIMPAWKTSPEENCQSRPGILQASLWAASIKPGGSWPDRLLRGTCALGMELFQGFHYFGTIFVLVGWHWYRRSLCANPAAWVLMVLAALYTLSLESLVVKEGYVSDRHVLMLVLGGTYLLAATLRDLPGFLMRWWSPCQNGRFTSAFAAMSLLLFVSACLPKALQPLHANRAGHLAAGRWLTQQIKPGDIIQDDHCWAHYYAGQVFLEGRSPVATLGYQPVCYIVVTRSRDPEVGKTREVSETKIRQAQGRLVFYWPQESPNNAKVTVYALPLERSAPFLPSY